MKYALLVLAILVLAGCTTVICNPPYIQMGNACCLDSNNNGICDSDEPAPEQPVREVVKEVQVTKYVCQDGTIVASIGACPKREAPPVQDIPELVTDNQKNTVIKSVNITPGCISGRNGGQIYFETGTVPANLTVQIKEGGKFYDAYSKKGAYQGYISFVACDNCKYGDFQLLPDRLYVMRMMFDQKAVLYRLEFSNEHYIDTTLGSEIMMKKCSG